MAVFSVIVAILSWVVGAIAFFGAPTAIQEIVGALIIINGSIFLVGAFVLETIQKQRTDEKNSGEENPVEPTPESSAVNAEKTNDSDSVDMDDSSKPMIAVMIIMILVGLALLGTYFSSGF